MKALVFDPAANGDGLAIAEVEVPVPKRGQALVRVKAASLNAGDWRFTGLGMKPKSGIPGSDFAGVVEIVGDGAVEARVGDAVVGDVSACGCGAFADFVCVPARYLARKPANLSFEEAAACPVAGVAALQALRGLGHVSSGDSALIIGAGGGVGSFAVQLARHFGARVTALCGPDSADQARALGAECVIDYRRACITEWGGPYDLVLAVHGRGTPLRYLRLLGRSGRFVRVGGPVPTILASLALGPILSLGRRKARTLFSVPDVDDLAFLLRLVSEGRIRPVIAARYRLSEGRAAFAQGRSGHARGKIVVTMDA